MLRVVARDGGACAGCIRPLFGELHWAHSKLQALVYDILPSTTAVIWRKVPESDARSVGPLLWQPSPGGEAAGA